MTIKKSAGAAPALTGAAEDCRWASRSILRLLSVVLLVGLWQTAALFAHSKVLPTPVEVLTFILREGRSGELLTNLGATLARVVIAFAVAMVLGTSLGIALGRSRVADRALDVWLLVLLNTPALVITVLCYVWLGLTETAALTAVVLNKFPNVAIILREGARSIDPQFEDMRRAFRMDWGVWARHILMPQLAPYAAAAARSGVALVWKIVLVVELLGRPNGVGYAISYHFQLFDVVALFGYSLVFTMVMLTVDLGLLQPLEAHARRWRQTPN